MIKCYSLNHNTYYTPNQSTIHRLKSDKSTLVKPANRLAIEIAIYRHLPFSNIKNHLLCLLVINKLLILENFSRIHGSTSSVYGTTSPPPTDQFIFDRGLTDHQRRTNHRQQNNQPLIIFRPPFWLYLPLSSGHLFGCAYHPSSGHLYSCYVLSHRPTPTHNIRD